MLSLAYNRKSDFQRNISYYEYVFHSMAVKKFAWITSSHGMNRIWKKRKRGRKDETDANWNECWYTITAVYTEWKKMKHRIYSNLTNLKKFHSAVYLRSSLCSSSLSLTLLILCNFFFLEIFGCVVLHFLYENKIHC